MTEQRLRAIEDVQEITRLKGRYTMLADSGPDRPHSGREISELFIEDGIWHIVPTGSAKVGRAAIKEHFDNVQLFPFSYHLLGNPIIEVDGDTARGQWHVVVAFTHSEAGKMWVAGYYDDEFVRTADGWRFRSLVCTAAAAAPYGASW